MIPARGDFFTDIKRSRESKEKGISALLYAYR